jgi:hypothetical protein
VDMLKTFLIAVPQVFLCIKMKIPAWRTIYGIDMPTRLRTTVTIVYPSGIKLIVITAQRRDTRELAKVDLTVMIAMTLTTLILKLYLTTSHPINTPRFVMV